MFSDNCTKIERPQLSRKIRKGFGSRSPPESRPEVLSYRQAHKRKDEGPPGKNVCSILLF